MAASDKSGRSYLKYGCVGCLGILALLILMSAGLAGVALLQVRSEEIENQAFTPEVPEYSASGPAGKIALDLSQGEFTVTPGGAGEPLRVHAAYDKNFYRLERTLETHEDSTWTYRVDFRPTGSSLITTLKEIFGGTRPDVHVFLPLDVLLDLDARVRSGGLIVDLGGLWLDSAEFHFQKGGIILSVTEPLREPMESLTIDGSMGGLQTSALGNASPRRLECNVSMGGMVLDLRGPWARDAEISISQRMGGGDLHLPRDVAIEGLSVAGSPLSLGDEVSRPTLSFTVSSSMGDFVIFE